MVRELGPIPVDETRLESLESHFDVLWGTYDLLNSELKRDGLSDGVRQLNRDMAAKIVEFFKQRVDICREAQQGGLAKKEGSKVVYKTDGEIISITDGKILPKQIDIKDAQNVSGTAIVYDDGDVFPALRLGNKPVHVTFEYGNDKQHIVINVGKVPFVSRFERITYYHESTPGQGGKKRDKAVSDDTLMFPN
ncbi:MAG TPA: hypothetical protein VJ065_02095 [Patescibacteria group bacterium]|nr:hypothetical protein [Patescibacteria group bacterium]